MQSFRGNVAVITGAASGIGAALALELAREGASLVLADISDAAPVTGEARTLGVEAMTARCDVSDAASVEALAAMAYTSFGKVNLLCNLGENLSDFPGITEDLVESVDHAFGQRNRAKVNVKTGRLKITHDGVPTEAEPPVTCGQFEE